MTDRQLTGDNGGAELVTVLDNLEQDSGLFRSYRPKREVVNNQDVDLDPGRHQGPARERHRALNDPISDLETELTASFEVHPDAEIIRSLTGHGVVGGARVQAEFGDDRTRYANAKCRNKFRRYRTHHQGRREIKRWSWNA
jgi:hypothetical protein